MDKGDKILDVYRERKHKYLQITVFLGFACFLILSLYFVRVDPSAVFLNSLCLILCLFFTIQAVLRDTKNPALILYENGIQSDLLTHSGARFILWEDIDNVVLESAEFMGKSVEVLRLIISSDLNYRRKLPLRIRLFSLEKSYLEDALSIPVSSVLSVDSLLLLKSSKTALENYRVKHGIKS